MTLQRKKGINLLGKTFAYYRLGSSMDAMNRPPSGGYIYMITFYKS